MKNKRLEKIHQILQTPKTTDGRIFFHPILMMHASKLNGQTYEDLMTDYKSLVSANMKCIELYDHDAVSVISDPYRETSAFGAKIYFNGDNSPKADKLIHSIEDVDSLANPDVYACERTLDRINGVKLFRELLGERFPIIGWVEGPLAEAADLAGMTEILMNMMIEPEMVHKLADKCLITAKDFALAQINAGANIIGVGDAICSQISEELYEEFAFSKHKELFDFIHSHGALVKLHICGNIKHLLPLIAQEDVDILDVDWLVDMADAHQILGENVVLCGNLDPVAVIMAGSKELIQEKYESIKTSIPAENWILMGGCEIPMNTPTDNMTFLREISKHSF